MSPTSAPRWTALQCSNTAQLKFKIQNGDASCGIYTCNLHSPVEMLLRGNDLHLQCGNIDWRFGGNLPRGLLLLVKSLSSAAPTIKGEYHPEQVKPVEHDDTQWFKWRGMGLNSGLWGFGPMDAADETKWLFQQWADTFSKWRTMPVT
jgi:hypothetical protein